MSQPPELRVGSKLWWFDENRRVYPDTDSWSRGPIWSEHWREVEVVGETKRSWLVGTDWRPLKLPKAAFRNGACPRGWARERHQIVELAWVNRHRSRIGQLVAACQDAVTLREIARLVGYEDKEVERG